ncbi:hypothetical protein PCANC_23381 [Puccinia coronata f. sp. avenae]|uniref:Uncharacterized protein n=1 Tax=Puccinia coronata f. sp. avenae TaxID=200324 RepID=A0A2N5SGN9_9BASI|nr:hypothetical protein PCANC_23381 [Puccinia coronata f. sp. avenae]PLW44920.1 hypothetical protein PCASD_09149 [Puccinia coronata f. sp. avenae]
MAAPHATAPVGDVNVNLAETRLLMPVILADPRAVSQRPVFPIPALPTGCAPFLTLVAWDESPYISPSAAISGHSLSQFHFSSQDRERMLLLHSPKALRPSIDHIAFLHLALVPRALSM